MNRKSIRVYNMSDKGELSYNDIDITTLLPKPTNGDVFRSTFPNAEIGDSDLGYCKKIGTVFVKISGTQPIAFDYSWWVSEYKGKLE